MSGARQNTETNSQSRQSESDVVLYIKLWYFPGLRQVQLSHCSELANTPSVIAPESVRNPPWISSSGKDFLRAYTFCRLSYLPTQQWDRPCLRQPRPAPGP